MRKLNIRKHVIKNEKLTQSHFAAFIVCMIFFSCGSVLGALLAGLQDSSSDSVKYITSLETAEGMGVIKAFFSISKYHLTSFILGFSLLGVCCIPLLSGLRGFSLAFTVSFLVRVFGKDCFSNHFAVYIVSALLMVPFYFLISVQAFCSSFEFLRCAVTGGARRQIYNLSYFVISAFCFLVLFLAAVIQKIVF